MDVEKVKNIFYLVGSSLGIIAFANGLLGPMLEHNRRRWKELLEHVSEEEFINLRSSIDLGQQVDNATLQQIGSFVRDIEEDAEYVRFGWPFRSRFRSYFDTIVFLHIRLRRLLQVPFWNPLSFKEDEDVESYYWRLDKDFFYKKGGRKAYLEHLDEISTVAENLRTEFRKISVLSNLNLVELPFASLLVKKRGALPTKQKYNDYYDSIT